MPRSQRRSLSFLGSGSLSRSIRRRLSSQATSSQEHQSSDSEMDDSELEADRVPDYLATPPPANGTPIASPSESSPPDSKPGSPFVERSNPMGFGNAQTVSSKDPKAVAQAATDMKNIVRRKLTGYVGFANLPNQWHRKSVRKGFNFNVMVVGEFAPRWTVDIESPGINLPCR